MKLLKEGNAMWDIVVCTRCKSQLEITQDDIYRDPGDYDDFYCATSVVRCVCGAKIVLHNLPKEVELGCVPEHIFYMRPQTLSLREVPDFPKKGILFKDISPLLANPKELKQLAQYLAGFWKGKIDKIGGFDARGFIFGSILAYEMGLPFFMLRKKGKLPGDCKEVSYDLEYGSATLEVQDNAVIKGERVLLIDDLLATGGTALAGCNLIEQLGGKIVGLQFVIELKDLYGREVLSHYKVMSILSC